MPARRKVPSYRLHKSSGRAVVTLNGRDFFLGRYGTDESRQRYDRRIAEWLAQNRRAPQAADFATAAGDALTIVELIARFWTHAQTFYRRGDGTLTSELDNFRQALHPVRALYGPTPAAEFGPLAIKAVRQRMIALGWCRSNINKQVARVRHVFKWGVSEELIPASTWHALQAVAGLKQGRSTARESEPVKPVPDAHVAAVLPRVSRQVRAMIGLQLLTGMRPGEVCAIRTCDIDTTGEIWTYKPAQHKTAHHGHDRLIHFGPQARALLAPFLKAQTRDYLFSPAEAEAERRAALHAARRTPLHQGNRPMRRKRALCERYAVSAYRRAIARACDAAFQMPAELGEPRTKAALAAEYELSAAEREARRNERREHRRRWRASHVWHPHQLRHNAATRLRKQFGLDAAQVILGHKTLAMTQLYAEKDREAAQRIMAVVG